MNEAIDWLESGVGTPPRKRWAFSTDAPIAALDLARESGETLVADETGGLYLFDRAGRLSALNRGFHSVSSLAIADVGQIAAVAVNETRLCRLDHQLKVEWSVDLPEPILGVAVDPFANRMAASLVDGTTIHYDAMKRRKGEFRTQRPLQHLSFVATKPSLIAAAEYGLIARYDLDGSERWLDQSGANVGGIAVTGNAERVYIAGFNLGIRLFDGQGDHRGSWILEGTVNHLDCSFEPYRIAATTQERHLYWLNATGEMVWGANLPNDVASLRCDPLGRGLVIGFSNGRVLRLDWNAETE